MKFQARKTLMLLAVMAIPLFFCSANAHAVLAEFSGFLSTGTPDGIDGTGDWATNFKISWLVEEQVNSTWKYTYTISKPSTGGALATSHSSLEVSPEATRDDFSDFNGSPIVFGTIDDTGFGALGPLSSGIKFDFESSIYSFFSTKAPVWGDFFSKGGRASCCGPANQRPFNTAWNADFLDADPTAGPQDGLLSDGQGGFIYKILRPDSTDFPDEPGIPEPTSLMFLGLGLMGGASFLKRLK